MVRVGGEEPGHVLEVLQQRTLPVATPGTAVRAPRSARSTTGTAAALAGCVRAGTVRTVCCGGVDVFVGVGVVFAADHGHELFVLLDRAGTVGPDQPATGLAEEQALLGQQVRGGGLVPVRIDQARDSKDPRASQRRERPTFDSIHRSQHLFAIESRCWPETQPDHPTRIINQKHFRVNTGLLDFSQI